MGCYLRWWIFIVCTWGGRHRYCSGGVAFDGWYVCRNRCGRWGGLEGDGNCAGQEPVGGLDAIGIRNGGLFETPWISEVADRVALFG